LNKESARGSPPALFVSDLHHDSARPQAIEDFVVFLRGPARSASALYVLGDLFDAWLGDDQMRESLPASISREFAALASAGVPVYLQQGNRDFLLGERFARASGATLLPDVVVHDLHGTRTVIMHGDLLCTDDADYQRFRAFTRSSTPQRIWNALPYAWRRGLAQRLRARSRSANATKAPSIMDVNTGAVEQAMREHGVTRMIHGHTHRPARHALSIDGREAERWVLGDWYARGSYLEVAADGIRVHPLGGDGAPR
jgi:UDP-2,3-diacylglucosamine hydrolase